MNNIIEFTAVLLFTLVICILVSELPDTTTNKCEQTQTHTHTTNQVQHEKD
jgi:hypothetical protein